MSHATTFVGIDAHKKSLSIALLSPGSRQPLEWEIPHEPAAVRALTRRLKREAPGPIHGCYEAGPCGYALQRELAHAGVRCDVVAPSLIPVKPGERIKTDRRDARKLAQLLRAGLLTAVQPPTPAEEAVRDLCRCREDAREDVLRARHRLGKMLLRRGLIYSQTRCAWTQAHRRWLRTLRFEHPAEQVVFDDYLRAIELLEERIHALETQLAALAATEPYRERVGWLQCFRGIGLVTAMTLLAELHDFRRFQSPRALMAYVGLVPSEHSSGTSRHRGAITKTGNRHVRRALVEASWPYRQRPAVGVPLRRRRQGQPGHIIALADRAQHRLHRRYWQLVTRGKPHCKAVIAIARELAGIVWAALTPPAMATP